MGKSRLSRSSGYVLTSQLAIVLEVIQKNDGEDTIPALHPGLCPHHRFLDSFQAGHWSRGNYSTGGRARRSFGVW